MIVATSIVLHRAMTFRRSESFTRWFGGILILGVFCETAYHSMNDEQIVHELCFVLLIILVAIRTRTLINARFQSPGDKRMLQNTTIFGAGTQPSLHREIF